MYKEILEALKAKFEGVNETVLSLLAHKMAKTVTTTEAVTTAVEATTIQQLIEAEGDRRATNATKTAVLNYEQKHGLKEGKPIESGGGHQGQQGGGQQPSNTQQQGADDVPAWAQQLIESNKQLSERLNKMDGERTTATRKQQLAEMFQKLPEHLRKPYERIPVDALTDEEFSTLAGELSTEIDALVQTLGAKGAVFGQPAAFHSGTSSKDKPTDEQLETLASALL